MINQQGFVSLCDNVEKPEIPWTMRIYLAVAKKC